jgi:magnesium-transporting ATPase (P-type)
MEEKLTEIAKNQEAQANKQERNFVDVWEPKKAKDKCSSYFQNTYEMWTVLWISILSVVFSSLVSAIIFISSTLLFVGMVQTQTKRFRCNILVIIFNMIVWVVCFAMKILYIKNLKEFKFTDSKIFKETIIFNELVGIKCSYYGNKNDLTGYLNNPSSY